MKDNRITLYYEGKTSQPTKFTLTFQINFDKATKKSDDKNIIDFETSISFENSTLIKILSLSVDKSPKAIKDIINKYMKKSDFPFRYSEGTKLFGYNPDTGVVRIIECSSARVYKYEVRFPKHTRWFNKQENMSVEKTTSMKDENYVWEPDNKELLEKIERLEKELIQERNEHSDTKNKLKNAYKYQTDTLLAEREMSKEEMNIIDSFNESIEQPKQKRMVISNSLNISYEVQEKADETSITVSVEIPEGEDELLVDLTGLEDIFVGSKTVSAAPPAVLDESLDVDLDDIGLKLTEKLEEPNEPLIEQLKRMSVEELQKTYTQYVLWNKLDDLTDTEFEMLSMSVSK